MNALVNDQVDRLYRWLAGEEQVTLLHFTSETPEDDRALRRSSLANQQFLHVVFSPASKAERPHPTF